MNNWSADQSLPTDTPRGVSASWLLKPGVIRALGYGLLDCLALCKDQMLLQFMEETWTAKTISFQDSWQGSCGNGASEGSGQGIRINPNHSSYLLFSFLPGSNQQVLTELRSLQEALK